MATHNLDLEFLDDRKSELPHNPIARICLKVWTHATHDGAPLITPNCVTIREFEYQIDRLKSELEELRKDARTKFAEDDRRQSARTIAHA